MFVAADLPEWNGQHAAIQGVGARRTSSGGLHVELLVVRAQSSTSTILARLYSTLTTFEEIPLAWPPKKLTGYTVDDPHYGPAFAEVTLDPL